MKCDARWEGYTVSEVDGEKHGLPPWKWYVGSEGGPGMTVCPVCHYEYVEWVNYREEKNAP